MAVDNAIKRYSVIGFDTPDEMMGPPDSSISCPDKAMMLHLYAGISLVTGELLESIGWAEVRQDEKLITILSAKDEVSQDFKLLEDQDNKLLNDEDAKLAESMKGA